MTLQQREGLADDGPFDVSGFQHLGLFMTNRGEAGHGLCCIQPDMMILDTPQLLQGAFGRQLDVSGPQAQVHDSIQDQRHKVKNPAACSGFFYSSRGISASGRGPSLNKTQQSHEKAIKHR